MGIKNAYVRTICIDSVEMPTNTRSGFTPIAIPEAKKLTTGVSVEYALTPPYTDALDHDMTPEQLYAVISEEIDDIYANGWLSLYH